MSCHLLFHFIFPVPSYFCLKEIASPDSATTAPEFTPASPPFPYPTTPRPCQRRSRSRERRRSGREEEFRRGQPVDPRLQQQVLSCLPSTFPLRFFVYLVFSCTTCTLATQVKTEPAFNNGSSQVEEVQEEAKKGKQGEIQGQCQFSGVQEDGKFSGSLLALSFKAASEDWPCG